MKKLLNDIRKMEKEITGKQVRQRIKEFEAFKNKPNEDWFSELCFCILTANSKFITAAAIQKELGHEGFMHKSWKELAECIRRNKHRFHNNKAKFIIEARKNKDIKNKITSIIKKDGEAAAREWLVKNIKGLGYKESSHFLRNTGCKNLAIVDRHILNLMVEYGEIKQKPDTVTKKIYFEIENKLQKIAEKLNMSIAELDLYMWSMKTGAVMR